MSERVIGRSTLASFVLLVFYVIVRSLGSSAPDSLVLFERGGLFMGAFVFYLGLLVMSAKWYHTARPAKGRPASEAKFCLESYLGFQALNVVTGLLAFYIGSIFHIGPLLGIGGTFFSLYLLEKYYEIPWRGVGWAWSLLGVAVMLYFLVGFANQHPQYFVWGMF